jgi:hypothetical protein
VEFTKSISGARPHPNPVAGTPSARKSPHPDHPIPTVLSQVTAACAVFIASSAPTDPQQWSARPVSPEGTNTMSEWVMTLGRRFGRAPRGGQHRHIGRRLVNRGSALHLRAGKRTRHGDWYRGRQPRLPLHLLASGVIECAADRLSRTNEDGTDSILGLQPWNATGSSVAGLKSSRRVRIRPTRS